MEIKNLDKLLFNTALEAVNTSFDVAKWARNVGVDLMSNQIEIVETINSADAANIVVLGSRSMGKTYAVAIAAIRAGLSIPGYEVLVFGPKQSQAKRIIIQIMKICKTSHLNDDVNWELSSQSKIVFKNMSTIEALSANEKTENEGWHGDLGIIDECLVNGSVVYLEEGKPYFIEDVVSKKLDLKILSYNEETNIFEFRKILDYKKINNIRRIVTVRFSDKTELNCTHNHEIFTDRGWVEAENLRRGDKVLHRQLEDVEVTFVRDNPKNEEFVYDLTVEHNHNYFANGILVHNCHRISDEVYKQKITPMFKSSRNPKLVKIGISLYNNNFRESYNSPGWTKLVYPWYKCPWLYKSKLITIDGIDYPKTVIDDMPLSYKRERFPNNPEVHYQSVNNLLEEEFDTQYEMKWCDSINKFLKEDELNRLYGSHHLISEGIPGETYYFGLDCAGGDRIEQGEKRDYTCLTIVRKTAEGVKEVVAVYEWQGNITDQVEEIVAVIHPEYGRFKCKSGTADYGSLGSAITDFIERKGVNIEGIKYKSTETKSGKNYKNAIFNQFLFELRHDKIKYPARGIVENSKMLTKHMDEWEALEKKETNSPNAVIAAPTKGGVHDDTCNSAALANWAAERTEASKAAEKPKPKIALGCISTHTSVNKTQGSMSNKFLR